MAVLDKINELTPEASKSLLQDFADVYFHKGFGLMNKTEIETLLYFVLKKNGLLAGKCFDDSIALEVPEAKVRRLLYESEIKYNKRSDEERDVYLRQKIGECLQRATFVKNNKQIKFVIEDKYLRVALNAKLRANGLFADTSFNTDIITLDESVLDRVINILVPNIQIDSVRQSLNAVRVADDIRIANNARSMVKAFIREVFIEGSADGLVQLGQWLVGIAA